MVVGEVSEGGCHRVSRFTVVSLVANLPSHTPVERPLLSRRFRLVRQTGHGCGSWTEDGKVS